MDEILEEAAERLLRAHRCRIALRQAPELVEHIRGRLQPEDEHVESRLDARPAETVAVVGDAADEIFVRLLEWCVYWAEQLGVEPPSPAVLWTRVDEDSRAARPERQALGFRAGTTPAGAGVLTRLLTSWLMLREDQIVEHEAAGEYQDDVKTLIWDARATYRLTDARQRPVRPRPCEVCGEPSVGVTWRSSELLDVEIRCEHCGNVYEAPRASDIERWLGESAGPVVAVSEVCERGKHKRCEVVACTCSCHATPKVVVGMGAETPMRPTGPRPSLPPSSRRGRRACARCQLFHPEGACDG
jgi:hypothetical protein